MISFKSVTLSIIVFLLFSGCDRQKEITELRQRVFNIEMAREMEKMERDRDKKCYLDASSLKKYQKINTYSGSFLVGLNDVKPYLDGYKLILFIGNPSTASYEGFSLKIKWGREFDHKEFNSNPSAYNDWEKSLQEKKSVIYSDAVAWNLE